MRSDRRTPAEWVDQYREADGAIVEWPVPLALSRSLAVTGRDNLARTMAEWPVPKIVDWHARDTIENLERLVRFSLSRLSLLPPKGLINNNLYKS